MKGWRTLVLNGALLLLAITDYLAGAAGLYSAVLSDPKVSAGALAGVNVLNIALRFATTTPVGKQ